MWTRSARGSRAKTRQRIEAIWHKIFRGLTYVGTRGATTAAISAVDIALWDIRGKVLGQPIYSCWAARCATASRSTATRTTPLRPKAWSPPRGRSWRPGSKAFKMDPMIPNLHVGNASFLDGEISADVEAKAMEILAAAARRSRPRIRDAHRRARHVQRAIRGAVGEQDGRVQHPLVRGAGAGGKLEGAQAGRASRSTTAICTGERLHTRWEFVPIFENGLADFVMPDVTWTGGISELKKIATMAEAYYMPISPHDASGPINVMAGAQVMMTVPNFYKLEVHRYDLSNYNVLIDQPLDVRAGHLYVPDRPGLGVELNPDALKEYEASPEDSAPDY